MYIKTHMDAKLYPDSIHPKQNRSTNLGTIIILILHTIIVGKKIQCQDFIMNLILHKPESLHLFMLIHKITEANFCGLPTSQAVHKVKKPRGFAVIVTDQ